MIDQLKTVPHQMKYGFDRGEKIGSTRCGWREGRKKYVCADGVGVEVAIRAFELC